MQAQNHLTFNTGYHQLIYELDADIPQILASEEDKIQKHSNGLGMELSYLLSYDNNKILSFQIGTQIESLLLERSFENATDPAIPESLLFKLSRKDLYFGFGYGLKFSGKSSPSYFFAIGQTAFNLGLVEEKFSFFNTRSLQTYGWSVGGSLGYRLKLNKKIFKPGLFVQAQTNYMRTYYFNSLKFIRNTIGIKFGLGYAF